jgi:homotetrameric cytidine deaminase
LELLRAAEDVRHQAYAPYSGFTVGAALRSTSGQVHVGCNVENVSWGLAICAERAAVFAAVAAEGSGIRIEAIAISAEAPSCPPCGACRQVLAEFGDSVRVIFPYQGRAHTAWLGDLLPIAFTEDLKHG